MEWSEGVGELVEVFSRRAGRASFVPSASPLPTERSGVEWSGVDLEWECRVFVLRRVIRVKPHVPAEWRVCRARDFM